MADLSAALAAVDRADYAAGVGFVRAREKRTRLTPARLSEMLTLDAAGVLARMRSIAPGLRTVSAGASADPDAVLGDELEAEYRAVEPFDHEGMVVPMLRWRHDLHNLRAALASRRDGTPARWSRISGNYPTEAIEAWAATGRGVAWPAILEPVAVAARVGSGEGMAEQFDMAWVAFGIGWSREHRLPLLEDYFVALGDGALVRQAWRRIQTGRREGAEALPTPPWSRLSGEAVNASDRRNLAETLDRSTYGRALRDGLENWRAGGPWAAVESVLENLLIERLRPGAFISLGPEPLAAFLLLREIDLRTVRLVHVLKEAGWSPDRIRPFARRTRHG